MSAEFIAEEGVLKGLILSLETGEEWSFGRDPDLTTIVLEDPKVSRKHMLCRKTPEGYVIENLSDTNPVLVNGEAISGKRLLVEGDLVTIDATLFHFYPQGGPGGFAIEPEYTFESDEQFYEEPAAKDEIREEGVEEPVVEETLEQKEEEVEEEPEWEEIFEEEEEPEVSIDLTPSTRFLIKVIAGPNTGAEFALDTDREYLIGTDPTTCDLIFNDLSVSREHARLSIKKEGEILIEDLGSRNGVVVDKERITKPKRLGANAVVSLGTSAILLLDKEAPSETIVAPIFEAPPPEKKEEVVEGVEAAVVEEEVPIAPQPRGRPLIPTGTLILALIVAGLAVLFGIGMVSLLHTKDIEIPKEDYVSEVHNVIKDYPAVRFTYNGANGKLFLMGHVQSAVQLNELLYKLKGLTFIRGLENNIVNDEAVWQEMNILLSKIPDFKGVSMHSPQAGVFVITGYLKVEKQAADLIDYLNVNFNYLNLLQNRVVVEQQIIEEVTANLIQKGFGAVTVAFSAGELQLTGYVSSAQSYEFENLVGLLEKIPGIRVVRNFVVTVSPEQGLIDLNRRFPGKYRVTGFSKKCDVNINVVINGRILMRGDQIDEMTITSIQPHTIFLEKEGLKYMIDYNK